MSKTVYVVGGGEIELMFKRQGFTCVNHMDYADLVCFTGGSDVDPSVYDHKRNRFTGMPNIVRDGEEEALFNMAVKKHIPVLGICRGSQLVCALSGGTLYQHVDGHLGNHTATIISQSQQVVVTSTHHQMMNPSGTNHTVLMATANKSEVYFGQQEETEEAPPIDYEVVLFNDTNALACQFHPEWMEDTAEAVIWLFEQIEILIGE